MKQLHFTNWAQKFRMEETTMRCIWIGPSHESNTPVYGTFLKFVDEGIAEVQWDFCENPTIHPAKDIQFVD